MILAGVSLCLYFCYHITYGKSSYKKLSSLKETYAIQEIQLSQLKKEHNSIKKKVKMMRPGETLSVDLMEEQIRNILGYHHKDELIVIELSLIHI